MPRPRGSVNKNTRGLLAELKRQFGADYHPVVEMARLANDKEATVEQRFAANKEVAKYVTPVLKAVEHKGTDGQTLVPAFVMIAPEAKK